MSADHEAVLAANEAFYRAFNARDARAMDALWAREAPAVCVHPGWKPLRDRDSVMASWRAILGSGDAPRVTPTGAQATVVGDVAWVVCFERVVAPRGGDGALVATNVFVREGGGWKMAHHHAGPLAHPLEDDAPEEAAAPAGKRALN